MKPVGFFINGEWVSGKKTFESFNPATGEIVGYAYEGDREDVEKAVSAARTAYPKWKNLSINERADFLLKAVDIILKKYGDEGQPTKIKELIHKEMGKMLPEADIEVIEASDILRFFATRGPEILNNTRPTLDKNLWPTKTSIISHEPYGIVGIIKPWNYPFELPIWSLGAALISGNTVVFKPSEITPLIGLEIASIFQEANLPPGVLNIVTGSGITGEYLVKSKYINKITFTGSLETGRTIAKNCSLDLKVASLELGGKDPAIVLPDANLELTSNGLLWGSFGNSGQVCTAIERAYIHESIFNQLIKILIKKTKSLKLGKDIAPLATTKQIQKVEDHINDAISKGAKVLIGGKRPKDMPNGYWYLPTILADVNNSMKVLNEETFGPILPIVQYNDIKEVIGLANNSQYGLGASIWSSNIDDSIKLAEEIKGGMVWINDVNIPFPQCPWGGIKNSGYGVELSDLSLYQYTRAKHLNYEDSDETSRIYWFPYNISF